MEAETLSDVSVLTTCLACRRTSKEKKPKILARYGNMQAEKLLDAVVDMLGLIMAENVLRHSGLYASRSGDRNTRRYID